ncbi:MULTISPECIES: CU044_2847 family protein [Streptomyces]|uniref:Trypsin-co-occurring domain-containing protein n=2 Tax=Streptomyces TaxID=1883 RepID=A0A3M8FDD5_9ACTN|nr:MULTISPECIES: CU044_2847 family protein [Streptomyces]KNE82303.1 hypothetical protein ADZ36_11460 [Streptomyces fradiae]OFA55846.1 hypothetical protein BEN35_06855 [Streptomyces fradiae]PQM25039.1 hypothetical protein Sfr7A_02475 [Streptomyces xinghaiensis]RKM99089.1 hypothetical protein SFRA_002475 [Streptomyces xinghaiensis]RNC76007.1 hypothetical protein DC095_001900 [Streptomyces xinghaiensis]
MIPVVLPSGREILLAQGAEEFTASQETGGGADAERYRDVAFRPSFTELVQVATEIGSVFRSGVARIRPSKATVALSVGVDAKSGKFTAFFADAGVSGGLTVTLEWTAEAANGAATGAGGAATP